MAHPTDPCCRGGLTPGGGGGGGNSQELTGPRPLTSAQALPAPRSLARSRTCVGPRQALHQHPWGREPCQALGRHQGSGQVVLSPGKGQGGTGQSANRPRAGRPGRCSGDVWRPEATWPDAGVTQHRRGSSEARGTALTPQAGPGLSDGRLGCAAVGPPEGARPTKARLSHRRRRDRTGGRCPGRSPCFLHPVWHWHPLQHLGPAGQPRAPALGVGKERGSHRAAPPGEEPRALAGRAQSGAFQTHRRAAPEALAWTMLGQLLSGRLPGLDGPRPTSSHHSHRLTPGP